MFLNALCRYGPAGTAIEAGGGAGALSILDVGSGPTGLAYVLADARFVGLDTEFSAPPAASMLPIQNPPGPLPFEDGAFDVVLCLDVLEHVPPAERESFVAELGRVAARRVLLACPCDEGDGNDAYLRDRYEQQGLAAPAWLDEHAEHGLPPAAEIERLCASPTGFVSRPWPMINGWLTLLVVLGDVLPEFVAGALDEYNEHREQWIDLLRHAEFGDSVRKGYVLERAAPLAARVPPDSPPTDVLAALRCRDCGETHRLMAAAMARCNGCGRELGVDAHGVWDLGRQEPPVGASSV